MGTLLDEAALARKHAVALEAVGLPSESKKKLSEFAAWCDLTYKKAQDAKMKKTTDITMWTAMMDEIKRERTWFENVRPVHDSMLRGLKTAGKPVKAGKGGKGKGAGR